MSNLARKLKQVEARLEEATVVHVGADSVRVRTDDATWEARRAKSCLVKPDVRDRVLVSFSGEGRVFVLAVLDGEDKNAKVEVQGDLELRVNRFDLTAAEGVDVLSGKEVSIASQTISARAIEADLVISKLAYVGGALRAELESIKTLATTCDSVFERISQRVKRSFRFVEDADTVKAGRIDYAAKDAVTMRSKNTVIAAEELMKVDAEQIQLG